MMPNPADPVKSNKNDPNRGAVVKFKGKYQSLSLKVVHEAMCSHVKRNTPTDLTNRGHLILVGLIHKRLESKKTARVNQLRTAS